MEIETPVRPAIQFVGFRGAEYQAAVRIWGEPDFIHQRWDTRARRELHASDTVIFARGTAADPPSRYSGPDIIENDV